MLAWTGGRFNMVGGRFSLSPNIENVLFTEMSSKEQQSAAVYRKLYYLESMKQNLSNKENFTRKAFRSSENEPFLCSLVFVFKKVDIVLSCTGIVEKFSLAPE